jgi:hypothetical protein
MYIMIIFAIPFCRAKVIYCQKYDDVCIGEGKFHHTGEEW